MGINIKDLRQRILFQSLQRTPDGIGGFTESWVNSISVWAFIVPTSAAERYFSQRIEMNTSHKIIIRWTDQINPEMRIMYENRIFQIHGIRRENEERWFLLIDAQEGVGS